MIQNAQMALSNIRFVSKLVTSAISSSTAGLDTVVSRQTARG
jgi:hypothetical protein